MGDASAQDASPPNSDKTKMNGAIFDLRELFMSLYLHQSIEFACG